MRSAVLNVISLARLAFVAARGRAARSRKAEVRLRAELETARGEIALLERELEIKDLRMGRVLARERPHYRPAERVAILELRAARGWSRREVARRFLLQPATVATWMARADEGGAGALLEIPVPANRLPDFIRYVVTRLKALCPSMGKKRIAQTLARAGLALATSTVGRILKERGKRPPKPDATPSGAAAVPRPERKPVKARGTNDVWQIDLTLVSTAAGFWTAWFPFAIPQIWPFCWWVACAVDQYTRRVVGFRAFAKEPTSLDMRAFLARLASKAGTTPRYVVSDKGRQFDAKGFRDWCRRRGIRPRYAAARSLRATAIVERFIRSLKEEWLRRIRVPLSRRAKHQELISYARWFQPIARIKGSLAVRRSRFPALATRPTHNDPSSTVTAPSSSSFASTRAAASYRSSSSGKLGDRRVLWHESPVQDRWAITPPPATDRRTPASRVTTMCYGNQYPFKIPGPLPRGSR